MLQVVNIVRGAKNKHIIEGNYDKLSVFGSCASMSRHDAERLSKNSLASGRPSQQKRHHLYCPFPLSILFSCTLP